MDFPLKFQAFLIINIRDKLPLPLTSLDMIWGVVKL